MKKIVMLIAMVLLSSSAFTQDKLYYVLEFMKVDDQDEAAYLETESFWEKIHEQRIKRGDLVEWDLWKLKSNDEEQSYQYLTINVYDNPAKMLGEWGDMNALAKKAFPKLSDEDINKKMNGTAKSRDLAVRYYVERIDKTDDNFDMPVGTIATLSMMKVDLTKFSEYEKAEKEVFKPMHQREIDNGQRSSWNLNRFISPVGSDTYASHITMNIYKDFNQFFSTSDDDPEYSVEEQKAIDDGIALRKMKYVHMAELIKKVR
ncbi:MAG: hypothetical protein QNJ57_13120 [Flavobacteriaceae bacterium]|nr:hypothetical protein [Flavobacteriaceae bacterium]